MIDVKCLEYIVVLANVRSIHKAADVLYISQPALSNALKKFESQLGITLFERSSNGVEPTAFCELLLPLAREILDNIESFSLKCARYSLMQNNNLSDKTLTISSYPMIASSILPNILVTLNICLPQLKIISKNLDMRKTVPAPGAYEIIVAFESNKYSSIAMDSNLEKVEICPVKPIVFMHPDLAPIGSAYISEEELSKHTIVTILKEYPYASLITRSYIEHLKNIRNNLNVFDVANGNTAIALVKKKQGVCFGVQIGLLIPQNLSINLIPLQLRDSNRERFSMVLIYRKDMPKEIIQFVTQILQNEFIFNIS